MPVLKSVLGLDLGSHSLKAVELQQTLRGVEMVQLRSLPRGDGEAALAEQIRQLVRLHRLGTDHVVAALPGDAVSTRRLAFPFQDRRKLTQAVPFAVEGDLPFELEQVVVDWELVGGDRARAEVAATIAPRAEVSRRLALLEEAGCPPRTLEAEGLALGNLAAVFDLPGVRLLADVGHRKTTFCLLADGRAVAARTVRLGGLQLTEALARELGVEPAEAERIKCGEDWLRGGRTPAQALAVLERLAREVLLLQGSLEEVTSRCGADRIEALTLLGGTAQLGGLDRFLAERTGIPAARLGYPREGAGGGLVAGGDPILFAPAIALALRGTAQARTRTNFRQDEFAVRIDLERLRRDFRWTSWLAAACAGLAAVSFATDAWLTSRQARELERASLALFREAFPQRPLPESTLAALRDEVLAANERADFLGVYPGNLSALDLLSQISRLVPPDLEVVFEELSIDRQTVRMRVYAKSFEAADRLGVELGKFEPFAGARIGAIETDPKSGAKRFNVTISLVRPEDRA
jgi:type IV pilus assembly protein PilM